MTGIEPRRLHEIARFLAVGAVAFAVQFGLLNVLVRGGMSALPANAVATCCSVLVAYVGNRLWSFAHRASADRRRELIAFAVVNTVTLGLSEAMLALVHLAGGRHDLALVNGVAVVSVGLGTVLRYLGYRRFVFRHDPSVPVSPVPPVGPVTAVDRTVFVAHAAHGP